MTKCNSTTFTLPNCLGRKVQGNFKGGQVSSDGGVLLLRPVDRRLGLTRQLAKVIADPSQKKKIKHPLITLLKQRIDGLACGYEDLNDHTHLRHDPGFQTAVERDQPLASASTLCRLDSRASREATVAVHRLFIDQFIKTFHLPPEELIVDVDATDNAVYGRKASRFFHGYDGHYCFLPLYVFCGDHLLVSYLRKSPQEAAKHAWAILSQLVKRLRHAFPGVKLIFRGDSGFCRHRLLSWCERHQVHYIVGIAKNNRLITQAGQYIALAKRSYEISGTKQRLFGELSYQADTWKTKRRVIVKAEHTSKGANPRFIVTTLHEDSQWLYDKCYCARGDMENRIKEQQSGLFANRTSCHRWWPNQFRLLLASAAYLLLQAIRQLGLKQTLLEKAQVNTIRLKLLNIGVVIQRNTRRVKFLFSSAYPYPTLFLHLASTLCPG